MGLFSVLFGRTTVRKPNRERYFSIITAADQLRDRSEIRTYEKSGIIFNPVESTFFENLDSEIMDLLRINERSTGTRFELVSDDFGTRWIVLEDRDFEDLVATTHLVAETFSDHGFGDRLLAAVVQLRYEGRPAYWIYSYKRGRFYPMVPSGASGDKQRDNAAEMRLGALMEEEKIPVEKSLESWYSLWGIPF